MKKEVELDHLCELCREKATGLYPCYGCSKMFKKSQLNEDLYNRCKKCCAAWYQWQGKVNPYILTTLNKSYMRERAYRKEIEKGVYGRDLIQPLDEKGLPNPDFVEHYGISNYTPEHKKYIRDKMGSDPDREKDWRTTQK